MHISPLILLGASSLLAVFILYRAGLDIVTSLSPQGCRMSWMSPSYVLQSSFDHRWTPLASRYSLFLYREVGWEALGELRGSPVLFIPGNAGSSHQVRSIASSATRQFFSQPHHVSTEFEHDTREPVDFFALEFNEDLSAFHGHTLDAEAAYARAAIDYILSLYGKRTSITILGHSMGGTVAISLLPHPDVSAIITMSTPHTLPPARLDRRVDSIIQSNIKTLQKDPTPVLSLCGGATDLLVPAESCILPVMPSGTSHEQSDSESYRRTVFTSALEGAWTGVGHQEMVWCHQVRWRVARAAIELAAGAQRSPEERGKILDRWLRNGHTLPFRTVEREDSDRGDILDLSALPSDELQPFQSINLPRPSESRVYLLPVPPSDSHMTANATSRFVLYLSRGSIAPISPRHALPLRISVFQCSSSTQRSTCPRLSPTVLKLVPEPVPGMPFPVPDEGSDESEGVVVFAADVPSHSPEQQQQFVAVRIEDADGRGWLTAGFVPDGQVVSKVGILGLVWSGIKVGVPASTLRTVIMFPDLLSSSLLVYKLTPTLRGPETCRDVLLPPLLQHTSHPAESHYFSLIPSQQHRNILLHSHSSGPFFSAPIRGFNLTVYSSTDQPCGVESLHISLDGWGTLGRWATRYAQVVIAWGMGVVAFTLHLAWDASERTGVFVSPGGALSHLVVGMLPRMIGLSIIVSLLPFPAWTWLGNAGTPILAIIAPLLLVIVVGLVCVSWTTVSLASGLLSHVISCDSRNINRTRESVGARRNALLSMLFVFVLIVVIIPWQVAILCAWTYHFYTCAVSAAIVRSISSSNKDHAIPLVPQTDSLSRSAPPLPSQSAVATNTPSYSDVAISRHHQNMHLLLLMTWLLPITAPVLAVWVRTLMVSGMQAVWGAGSGWGLDKNVFAVVPWLVVVEWAGVGGTVLGPTGRNYFISPRHGVAILATAAFCLGPRATYIVFEVGSAALLFVCVSSIGPRYWNAS